MRLIVRGQELSIGFVSSPGCSYACGSLPLSSQHLLFFIVTCWYLIDTNGHPWHKKEGTLTTSPACYLFSHTKSQGHSCHKMWTLFKLNITQWDENWGWTEAQKRIWTRSTVCEWSESSWRPGCRLWLLNLILVQEFWKIIELVWLSPCSRCFVRNDTHPCLEFLAGENQCGINIRALTGLCSNPVMEKSRWLLWSEG